MCVCVCYLILGLRLLEAVLSDEAVGLGESQRFGLQQVLETALLGLGTQNNKLVVRCLKSHVVKYSSYAVCSPTTSSNNTRPASICSPRCMMDRSAHQLVQSTG